MSLHEVPTKRNYVRLVLLIILNVWMLIQLDFIGLVIIGVYIAFSWNTFRQPD